MYSQGTSSRVRVRTYAGEGKIILNTEIKLKLHGRMLNLLAIEEYLNNGSGFSFPVEVTHRDFNLVPHRAYLHPAGGRQSFLLSHLSGTGCTGSSHVPEQSDQEITSTLLNSFQHYHLCGAPHLHHHQHCLCQVLNHPGQPGSTPPHHLNRRFH